MCSRTVTQISHPHICLRKVDKYQAGSICEKRIFSKLAATIGPLFCLYFKYLYIFIHHIWDNTHFTVTYPKYYQVELSNLFCELVIHYSGISTGRMALGHQLKLSRVGGAFFSPNNARNLLVFFAYQRWVVKLMRCNIPRNCTRMIKES